jgi:hypothetical protein
MAHQTPVTYLKEIDVAGCFLLSASEDGEICIWTKKTCELKHSASLFPEKLRSVTDEFVIVTEGGKCLIWDLSDGVLKTDESRPAPGHGPTPHFCSFETGERSVIMKGRGNPADTVTLSVRNEIISCVEITQNAIGLAAGEQLVIWSIGPYAARDQRGQMADPE